MRPNEFSPRGENVSRHSRMPSLTQVVEVGNLLRASYELKSRAGQAPGIDRITYAEIGHREAVER
jgi:hypothetical protein